MSFAKHPNDQIEKLPEEPAEILQVAWGGILTPLTYADRLVFGPIVGQRTVYNAKKADKLSIFAFSYATGQLIVINTVTGGAVWRQDLPSPAVGGVTVVNHMGLTAGFDGDIRLFSTAPGTAIGHFSAHAGIHATPVDADGLIIIPASGPYLAAINVASASPISGRPRVIALGSGARN